MLKKINLSSPITQYTLGVILNLLIIILLFSTDVSYKNIQLPEGEFKNNIWNRSDVMTYVVPARNFLTYGHFGYDPDKTDIHRTIGYPLFLAIMMKIFGNNWLLFTFIVQALIFALAYPLLGKYSDILFPGREKLKLASLGFFYFSGAYSVYTTILYTDLMLGVLFITGLYFGILAILKQRWIYLLPELLIIGYASLVRPTLTLFPVVNALFMLWISRKYDKKNLAKTNKIIIVSSLFLILLTNLSSIRNYVNHGIFVSTDVMHNNMCRYLAKNVLSFHGKKELAIKMIHKTERELRNDHRERLKLQKEFSLETYKKYPLTTGMILLRNVAWVMFDDHWQNIGHFWNLNWHSHDRHFPNRSFLMLGIFIFWNMINLVIYIFFIKFIISLIKKRDWLLPAALFLFLAPLYASFVAGFFARMRLPVEGIATLCSFSVLFDYLQQKFRIFKFLRD